MHLLYKQASDALEKCLDGKASVKSACLSQEVQNKRATYAITVECLKYRTILQALAADTGLAAAFPDIRSSVLYVLIFELLLSKSKKLRGGGVPIRAVLSYESQLRAELQSTMEAQDAKTHTDLLPDRPRLRAAADWPRYARVNTLHTTVDDVVAQFVQEGYNLCETVSRATICRAEPKNFGRDDLLNDLLQFGPGTDLHDHALVNGGRLILQDKASCFPAHVLQPARGSHVIDACAAPGNKTSHAAAFTGLGGKVFAFDLSKKRCQLLQNRMRQAGATNVQAKCFDFLKIDPKDRKYANVQYILLDPSCSGSGMVDTQGITDLADAPVNDARLARLAEFQLEVITHAFKFPACVRVSYSTCSIHSIENEDVVAAACERGAESGWQLANCLDGWARRGEGWSGAEMCVRANPIEDRTNGFFVACFERPPEMAAELVVQEVDAQSTAGSKRKRENKEPKSSIPAPIVPSSQKTKRKKGKPNVPIKRR